MTGVGVTALLVVSIAADHGNPEGTLWPAVAGSALVLMSLGILGNTTRWTLRRLRLGRAPRPG